MLYQVAQQEGDYQSALAYHEKFAAADKGYLNDISAKALAYQDKLMPLHEAIFIEPGLVGAKFGLSLLGLCNEEVRLPLVTLTDGTKAKIKSAMQFAGLL